MAFIKQFGSYLPPRVVSNEEIGARVGCDSAWILSVAGIEERRFAEDETVVDMALRAAQDCLSRAGMNADQLGMLVLACSSWDRRYPGPAVSVAQRLGLTSVPCLDLPMASAGSLFGMALAAKLTETYGDILVIGAEKMSSVILREPMERGVAILFGDGAGSCILSADSGCARVVDSVIESDGTFSEDLQLKFELPLEMNGRSVILQASRKIPRVIEMVLGKHGHKAGEVDAFLMHQANQNLIARIASALGVAEQKFFTNIRRYGNTSSASMLIAATEWWQKCGFQPGVPVCFAAFGAGFNWGAMLVEGVTAS